MTVEELITYYADLLSYAPKPVGEPNSFNFFEVAGFRHYEDVVSNCYAFFFGSENPHGLGKLFVESLTELIGEKGLDPPVFEEGECYCQRERGTDKGNFIDLLLYDQAIESATYQNAIVIENKVYASLYNDLADYLNDVRVSSDGRKVGVVLTLHPTGIPPKLMGQYVNITHAELSARLRARLGKYLFGANEKALGLLKDFLSNLDSLLGTTRMDERIKFYYQNATKIKELVDLHQKANSLVAEAIRTEAQKLSFTVAATATGNLNLKLVSLPGILTSLYLEKLLPEQLYVLDLWMDSSRVPAWKGLSEAAREELETGNGPLIEIQKPKARNTWGLVAKAVIQLDKSYRSVEGSPQLIADYLETHWKPLLDKAARLIPVTTE